jgi:putative transposase
MLICQVIELDPSESQRVAFVRHAAAARIARNDVIALWREEGRRLPGFRFKLMELRPQVNRVKYQRHPWFRELNQNAIKGGMIDAQDAISRYYGGQNRRPRFHGKSRSLAFRADNGPGTVRMDSNRIQIPAKMGGVVKTKEVLRWPGKVIRECRIREKGGRWYASVRVEIDPAEYGQGCGDGVAGIDLGLSTFATIAYPDGTHRKVQAPEPFRRSMKALRRAQRKLSRRKPGSSNRSKAKLAVAKRHRRMADTRKDFLHKLTHELTAEVAVVQVEGLSLKGWQRRWGRKTSDLAPAEFLRQLEYKLRWRGGELVVLPWHFPSSQVCHDCGARGGKLPLEVRRWVCESCGVVQDRDTNAARNIRDFQPGATGRLPVEVKGKTGTVPALTVEAGTHLSASDYVDSLR